MAAPVSSTLSTASLDVTTTRAALVATHAAVRTFFPYFKTIPDTWDDAFLAETGRVSDASTAYTQLGLLREMGVALDDGHVSVQMSASFGLGYVPLMLDILGGDVVVMQSQAEGVRTGDRIVSIGGVPVADLIAKSNGRTSGSAARKRRGAANDLAVVSGPTPFVVQDLAGATKTVTLGFHASLGVNPWPRERGSLANVGAADTYYVSQIGRRFC